MSVCKNCHSQLVQVDSAMARVSYVCPDANCPSHGGRRLKCPNPKCKGRPLMQESLGKDHFIFKCASCPFGFDNLGILAPRCPICNKTAKVFETVRGFVISCPTGDKQPIRVEWQAGPMIPD